MGLTIITLSESDTERQMPHDTIYIWNPKYDTNKLTCKAELDSQTWKQTDGYQGEWECCSCSVAQSCPALRNLMDCSRPGFPVLHHLLESPQTHVHWVVDATQHHPTTSSSVVPFSSCLQSFPVSGSFLKSRLFASGGQIIGASVSDLPMNIQGWFLLELIGLISLQSKGLSRVFSNITKYQFESINSSALRLFYCPPLTSVHDYWKNHSFD